MISVKEMFAQARPALAAGKRVVLYCAGSGPRLDGGIA